MEVLDLFSAAAGGWSLGMHRAGFRTVAACEFVAWRRALYAQNNPGVLIYDDVRTLSATRLISDLGHLPDIIVGSPPCQDISSANAKGRGVDGEHSGLFFEATRIIGECRPRWFALENSDRVRVRGYDRIASELESSGYTCWPIVVGAGHAGAAHLRKRCIIVGMVADAANQQAWAPRQPRLGSNPDSLEGQAARPTSGGRQRGAEEARCLDGPMDADADSDQLWVEQRRSSGETGASETIGWLAGVFRGPSGSEPLSRHLRAYDGLPAWLAEQCRQAYGDAVLPQVAEVVGRAILRTEAALASIYARAAA